MIELDDGVIDYVREDAKNQGLRRPVVRIMGCGCVMNQDAVELDVQEEEKAEGCEFYMEVEGVRFFVSPKVRHLANRGKIGIMTYGAGRFKRLVYFPLL